MCPSKFYEIWGKLSNKTTNDIGLIQIASKYDVCMSVCTYVCIVRIGRVSVGSGRVYAQSLNLTCSSWRRKEEDLKKELEMLLSLQILSYLFILLYISEVYSLAIPSTQLGKVKRKLRGIANTLKQDVNEPLVCIQCSKSSMEEITPSFLSNLGKYYLTSHHFTSCNAI